MNNPCTLCFYIKLSHNMLRCTGWLFCSFSVCSRSSSSSSSVVGVKAVTATNSALSGSLVQWSRDVGENPGMHWTTLRSRFTSFARYAIGIRYWGCRLRGRRLLQRAVEVEWLLRGSCRFMGDGSALFTLLSMV